MRHGVVRTVEPELRLRLDIEVEKQKQQLLEAVGKIGLVLGLELILAQAVEIAIEPREVSAILVDLERLHRKRERVRTVHLETLEDPEPVVDAPRAQQRIAQRLVRRDMPRIARDHLFECGNRRVGAALFLKNDADVEVRGDQIRVERERPLISTQRVVALMHHLQRDAMVVMRLGIGGQEIQNRLESGARRNRVMPCELRQSQRTLDRQARIFIGGQRQTGTA